MTKAFLVLGNQLFDPQYILKDYKDHKDHKDSVFYISEDIELCTYHSFHKHKIFFFLASMREYAAELKEQGYRVHYHELCEDKKSYEERLLSFLKSQKIKEVSHFEMEDSFFDKRIRSLFRKHQIEQKILASPMFLNTQEQFQDYLGLYKKPFMKNFYELKRKEMQILVDTNSKPLGGKWSFDAENRKKFPKDISIPTLPSVTAHKKHADLKSLIDRLFSKHPGDLKNFYLPITRRESENWLKDFLEHRLAQFGVYEDAISSTIDFGFHSLLSPLLNIGWLTPKQVLDHTLDYYQMNEKELPLNSVEGFVRQIMGWREFLRGIYREFGDKESKANFFQHRRRMNSNWYSGTTGIAILDASIQKADRLAYCHHIERLMVLSNFMLLAEIQPTDVYNWFMEMFVDSSDWVMVPNVFGMGQFSDGGIFATKPYVCGSNYLLKMSDFTTGDWTEEADGLYWHFIYKNKDFYSSNPRMGFAAKTLDRMNVEKKKKLFAAAERFIERNTH